MKKRSSSKASKTDWKRLRAMKDDRIKLSEEHPELDLEHVARTIVRKGLRPVLRRHRWRFGSTRMWSNGSNPRGRVIKPE
jgi:hypothetical protein